MSGVGACKECATAEGCSEHMLFTCSSCGKRVPWSDAADDERPLDCSDCWSAAMLETELVAAFASAPPRAFVGQALSGQAAPSLRGCRVPSTDTLSQPPRSWPPYMGCDPVEVPGDQGSLVGPQVVLGVVRAAERVRTVVEGAVLAALASEGVPEISVEASCRLATCIAMCAAEQLAMGLWKEARE